MLRASPMIHFSCAGCPEILHAHLPVKIRRGRLTERPLPLLELLERDVHDDRCAHQTGLPPDVLSRWLVATALTSSCNITYICEVSPRTRKLYSFWIDPAQAEALKRLKARDGVPESEQIRRAIDKWIAGQGRTKKTAPRRADTRRRA